MDTLKNVIEFHRAALAKSAEAQEACRRLGLTDALCDRHDIGWSDGSVHETAGPGTDWYEDVSSLGVFDGDSEAFLGCITIPIIRDSVVANLAAIDPEDDGSCRMLAGLPAIPWNIDILQHQGHVIVTTRLVDALVLTAAGYDNVMATCGTAVPPGIPCRAAACTLVSVEGSTPPSGLPEGIETHQVDVPAPSVAAYFEKHDKDALQKLLTPPEPDKEGVLVVQCQSRLYKVSEIARKGRKLNVQIRLHHGGKFLIDDLNLLANTRRNQFCRSLTAKFGISRDRADADIAEIIRRCEEHLEQTTAKPADLPEPTPEELEAAREFGRAWELPQLILRDYQVLGIVNEQPNCILSYLCMTSRKMDEPLGLILTSSSAAGKSTIQKATTSLCPPEDRLVLTAISPKGINYLSESLSHKFVAIDELDGAVAASPSLRVLMTEKSVTTATTGQDPKSGAQVTYKSTIEGPIALMTTTTDLDYEWQLRTRLIESSVDESPKQTDAIKAFLGRRAELPPGTIEKQRQEILARHHAFQRLLLPLKVVIPNADRVLLKGSSVEIRRTQEIYHSLVKAVAFLRQMGKSIKTENGVDYIEADDMDIEIAEIIRERVFDNALADISPQARMLLSTITTMLADRGQERFSAKQLEAYSGQKRSRVHQYLKELADNDYLVVIKPKPFHYSLPAKEDYRESA